MGFGRRELQQLTIQLSLGMNMLFMGGDWIEVDWDCCTPHQWVMLVIFRIAWIYIGYVCCWPRKKMSLFKHRLCVNSVGGDFPVNIVFK